MTDLRYCKACFEKQQLINRLAVENEKLKAQLRAQERSAREGAFGASTPSSKIPIKPNTLGERQARCGGLEPGHAGHGRATLSEEAADRVERVSLSQDTCPDCGVKLLSAGLVRRTLTDLRVQRVEKVLAASGTQTLPAMQAPVAGSRAGRSAQRAVHQRPAGADVRAALLAWNSSGSH